MSDPKKINPNDLAKEVPPAPPSVNPMKNVENVQKAMAESEQRTQFEGQMPDAFKKALAEQQAIDDGQTPMMQSPQPHAPSLRTTGSPQLEELLARVTSAVNFAEVELPSRGIAYGGEVPDGVLHIRHMTGEEEQILATPKYVRTGQAVNMIFKRCIKETLNPELLLTADRTYLLIFLRAMSYGQEYEVEIKCPECTHQFQHQIDLDADVALERCPDEFDPNTLHGVLPSSGLKFSYRLSTGRDEIALQRHREQATKNADQTDDTLTFRTAQLLEDVEGMTDKHDLQTLIKKLPINDVSYLRNLLNNPPFGVDTQIGIACPMCWAEFKIDLPMEANFFFPRRSETNKEMS